MNEHTKHSDRPQGLSFVLKPFLFVVLMWVVFYLDQRFYLDLYQFGILPRQFGGLNGVIASPLIHGSLMHLANNTLPILALGMGLFYFYPRIAVVVIIVSWLSSGLAVWLIGRESYHIGASGLIYALAGFIFLSGLLRRQANLLALSLLVVFLYGGMVWGILPIEEKVSWEAHLAGGISGFALAVYFRKIGPSRRKYSWELEETEDAIDEDINFTDPKEPWGPKREVWEDYANSVHGIRYIMRDKEKKKDEQNNS
ncbi:MAG: rhomboid family intramembrane serine protease [Owenweeksia sp.]|nr:rhomboid family intramembrane serine protease [Owenweeksia sp.]